MSKFYITTAIPYPNGKPHIGFGLEVTLGDVIARYHRLLRDEVFYLNGTDEHGLKVITSAQKEGISFQEYVDKNTPEFQNLKEVLNISYDDFIRTSDKTKHWPGVVEFWKRCLDSGKIYKKTYEGLYCIGCEEFKNEKDLVGGLCPEHKTKPEKVEEENYFFKLSDYTNQLNQLITSNTLEILPKNKRNEILSFLKQGLEDFSISRPKNRIPWGVPVPGDDSQTIYVWFDALINYISDIGFGRDEKEFAKWWPADLHVIGKGISRFHALYWPAMLWAAGLELPKRLLIHSYVNIAGEKISKSLGNVISPREVLEKYPNIPKDALRYFLLRYIPLTDDGNFSYEEYERVYNGDLANGLGNLVARVAKLCENIHLQSSHGSENFYPEVELALKEFKFNEALSFIWTKISESDRYINEKKPWELNREDTLEVEQYANIVAKLSRDITHIAFNLQPFLPETAEKILKQFSGEIKSSQPLFPRIA